MRLYAEILGVVVELDPVVQEVNSSTGALLTDWTPIYPAKGDQYLAKMLKHYHAVEIWIGFFKEKNPPKIFHSSIHGKLIDSMWWEDD